MNDLRSLSELRALRAETEENRIDFLRTDLALCFTFIDLAKTEIETGDRDTAMRVCAKAEDGYATIARFVPEVNNPEHRNHITQRLEELRAVLDLLQQRLQA
jgi:hypothetical protein